MELPSHERPFSPFKPPLWFDLFYVPEVLLRWMEQELLALAFAALMVVSPICVGRSQPVTHAYLWGMQQLKHGLTNPHECTVTSECFQQVLPITSLSTASRIKVWWSELGDTYEHLLKEVGESVITAKPAVEINIIGVRLNFLSPRLGLLPPEKLLSIFKFTLIWNIPPAELSHAFRITTPCCVFKHYE